MLGEFIDCFGEEALPAVKQWLTEDVLNNSGERTPTHIFFDLKPQFKYTFSNTRGQGL